MLANWDTYRNVNVANILEEDPNIAGRNLNVLGTAGILAFDNSIEDESQEYGGHFTSLQLIFYIKFYR